MEKAIKKQKKEKWVKHKNEQGASIEHLGAVFISQCTADVCTVRRQERWATEGRIRNSAQAQNMVQSDQQMN